MQPQGLPPQGYPPGMPPQGYPPGMPPQGYPPGAMPPVPPKKTSPVVYILGGCGVLVLLAMLGFAALGFYGYRKAKSYAEGAGQMNTVTHLWSDVPPMEGMSPNTGGEMPLAVRALARPMLDNMLRDAHGKEVGHWDVAFYVLNGKTTRDVEAFYVPARMTQHGWQQQGGCTNATQVTFCAFQKQEGASKSGLLVISADDPNNKSTALYFIRQDATQSSR
jgi:hypothetical protein